MSTGITIRKADRSKRKARVGLLGPTGSGKTLSALLIANGFGGRTCLIDTENNSADLYSDSKHLDGFEYDVIQLQKPYSVERYLEALTLAEKEGYHTIIVDSLSHAWAGPGGLLEFVDTRTNTENKFAAWREATPKHNDLVSRLVNCPAHLIITMRVKMDYVLEENDRGKKVPKKVGLQPVQRDGLEYEFDVVFDIDTKTHLASSTKDRSSIFDGEIKKITAETGASLMAWLNKGKDVDPEADAKAEAAATAKAEEARKVAKTELDSGIDDIILSFQDCDTLPGLAAQCTKAETFVKGFRERLPKEDRQAAVDKVTAAKDKRKAELSKPPADEPETDPNATLTPDDVARLERTLSGYGLSLDEAYEVLGVKRLSEVKLNQYAASVEKLAAHAKAKAEAAGAPKSRRRAQAERRAA